MQTCFALKKLTRIINLYSCYLRHDLLGTRPMKSGVSIRVMGNRSIVFIIVIGIRRSHKAFSFQVKPKSTVQ